MEEAVETVSERRCPARSSVRMLVGAEPLAGHLAGSLEATKRPPFATRGGMRGVGDERGLVGWIAADCSLIPPTKKRPAPKEAKRSHSNGFVLLV
jgi:hypothetical protein